MKKILLVLLLLIYFFTAPSVLGYSAKTTHPALTSQVVSFYNYLHPDKPITEEQKEWLMLGSELEDTPPRWVNHFYDPIRKISWNYETMDKSDKSMIAQVTQLVTGITKTTAIDWVNNTIYQRRAEGGERTFGKAISYLADNNEKEGFITLGHVLHLLEDMGVPAHTRNDPHPDVGNLGSPYEKFARGYNVSNIEERTKVLEKLKSKNIDLPRGKIEDHLIEMAKYSNKYFFSKDTVESDIYSEPKVIYIKNNIGYGLDENDIKIPLVLVDKIRNEKTKEFEEFFNISNNEPKYNFIFEEYFNRLSYQIVLRGVAILEMVPDEILKELENRKYGAGNEGMYRRVGFLDELGKDRSIVGGVSKAWGGVKSFFGNISEIIKETFESEDSFNQSEEISLLNKEDKVNNLDLINDENKEENITKEDFTFCVFNKTGKPRDLVVRLNEIAWMGDKDSYKNEWIELKNVFGEKINISGYQVVDFKNQIEYLVPNNTYLDKGGFYLIKREGGLLNNHDDVYKGALSNSNEGLAVYNKNCDLNDIVYFEGDWPEGDNSTKQTMERKDNLEWQTSSEIGGTPKAKNSIIKIKEEKEEEKEKDEEEEELDNEDVEENKEVNNEENNETEESLETAENNSSDNNNENEIFYSECSFETNFVPTSNKLIINEIAWMGTNESSNDEWIELKNISDEVINLDGYQLVDKEEQVHIIFEDTDVIESGGYYLLERTDENSVIGVLSDKIYIGSLKNSDEGLRLFDNDCNLLDEYVTESDWVEGNNILKKTMERRDNLEWQTSSEVGGTPKEKNSDPVQVHYGGTGGGSTSSGSDDYNLEEEPENEKPISNFIYFPDSSSAGDRVLFDASSSTDPDGFITYFKWDFDTDFITTTTENNVYYIYKNPGNYSPILTVYDNKGGISSSTISIEISEDNGSLANNIVISEIMPGISGNSDKEFIELYNPTNEDVDLTGWSLERNLDRNTTSTQILVESFTTSTISSHSFFLIKSKQYEELDADEIYTNKSYHLAYSDNGLILKDNNNQKIDEYFFDSVSRGYSLERKSFENNSCYVAQNDYEYLGNGCDINNFDEREEPNPQNSNNLKEPRNNPISEDSFSVSYNEDNLNMVFDWGNYKDEVGATSSISYEIKEYNSPGVVIYSSSSIGYVKNINEVGRDYNFSFQAFDRDGLGSEITTTTVSVPSFFDNFYFYNNTSTTDYLADFYYSSYPFIPDKYAGIRKALVAYLNKEVILENSLTSFNDWNISNRDGLMSFIYDDSNRNKNHKGLIPVFSDKDESSGGGSRMKGEIVNYSSYKLGEDNHIILKFASSTNEIDLTNDDYINFGFYGFDAARAGRSHFKPIAIDKTKYYFQEEVPDHKSPLMSNIDTNFDGTNNLEISWNIATDEDTIDSEIIYEINFVDLANSSSTNFHEDNWQNNDKNISYVKNVAPEDSYLIGVRALDDFNNYSNIATTTWSYPYGETVFEQNEMDRWTERDSWGSVVRTASNADKANFQSVVFSKDTLFNKALIRLKQISGSGYVSDIRLSILNSSSSNPDFDNVVSTSVRRSIQYPDESKDFVFNFEEEVLFKAGEMYWFVLDSCGSVNSLFKNKWANGVKSGSEIYEEGVGGSGMYKGKNNTCEEIILNDKKECSFNEGYNFGAGDWYLKLILE
jgi:hypothetical protein